MAANYDAMAQYFSRPVEKPGASVKDIANLIILGADRKAPQPKKPESDSSSFIGWLFDKLSRPNYAVAEFARHAVDTGELDPGALWAGFSGEKKTTFSKVLEEAGMDEGPARSLLGLGLDIGLDPLTYVGGAGIASKLNKSATTAAKISKPKVLQELKLNTEAPAAFKAPVEDITTTAQALSPKLPAIKFTPKSDPDALFDVPNPKTPDVIINDLARGDIGAAASVIPKPHLASLTKKDIPSVEEILKAPGVKELDRSAQVRLYNRALEAAKKQFKNPNSPSNRGRITQAAYNIYKAVEAGLEAKGLSPVDKVRLSEVIIEAGGPKQTNYVLKEFTKKAPKPGTPTWQALQNIRARNAVEEGLKIKGTVDAVAESKAAIRSTNVLSDGQEITFDKFLKGFAKNQSKALTPDGTKAAASVINMALMSGKSAAQIALQQKSKVLDDVITRGKIHTEVNRVTTLALERDLGKLPKWALSENKSQEFIMGRIATWWGQSDLRRTSLEAISSSMATAAARGKVLDRMFKDVTPEQAKLALGIAQGKGGPAGDAVTAQLGDEIGRMMDNMFGQVAGGSVLTRSGVSMVNLNKWLKHYNVPFEFSKKAIKTSVGTTLDLSKGSDWTNTWKAVDIKEDPKVFLFKTQQALEQATREKGLFDQLAEELGSTSWGKGFDTKLKGYDYVDGYYFPREIAKQLPRVIKDWSGETWKANSPIVRHYDRILSMWKAGVTIYRPGHHVRNLIGDVYLGWMDGVNSARPYLLAAKVQRASGAYKDMADVDRLVQIGALSKAYRSAGAGEIIFRNKSGVGFTADQIYAVAHQKGLLEHTNTIEDIMDMGGDTAKRSVLDIKPFGGKVQAVARGASELQSHNTRLAHFIDKVMKSRGQDLNTIFSNAAARARKWHPTGIDLTMAEKKIGRRVIPFYTWIRKSVPLLLEGLVANPGKVVIPAKILGSVQEMAGIETPGRHDPFPVDQMFPSWIKDQGVGPISAPEGLLGNFTNQTPPGYAIAGMGLNPLSDLLAQIQNPGKSATSMISPAAQIPVELLSGRELFTQEPISGSDARPGAMGEYVGENLPLYSAFQGITGVTPFGGETKAHQRSDDVSREALTNWATGLGIKGTGPYVKQAVYEKLKPGQMARKMNREEFLADLRRRLEEG